MPEARSRGNRVGQSGWVRALGCGARTMRAPAVRSGGSLAGGAGSGVGGVRALVMMAAVRVACSLAAFEAPRVFVCQEYGSFFGIIFTPSAVGDWRTDRVIGGQPRVRVPGVRVVLWDHIHPIRQGDWRTDRVIGGQPRSPSTLRGTPLSW